jgi:hypothetical protein
VSLASFQDALANLVASPELCGRLATDAPSVLKRYALDARERSRLVEVVSQRGMSINCTLYRAGRFEAVYTLLPMSCFVLGDRLRSELDEYWRFREHTDLQFRTEVACWTDFLRRRLREGRLTNPYLREVLAYEVVASDLSFGADPPVQVVAFSHDPAALLGALQERRIPPSALDAGAYYVLLDYSAGRLRVTSIGADLARVIAAEPASLSSITHRAGIDQNYPRD